mmetsp:Transcript_1147/g.1607  ORF Transcript_1147/g.1607 Transcript_1147/m.1607 type:complete len:373 (-) Transcript_1147:299-1417(-)
MGQGAFSSRTIPEYMSKINMRREALGVKAVSLRAQTDESTELGITYSAAQLAASKDEDRYSMQSGSSVAEGTVNYKKASDTLCIGVYDGHGSSEVADYLREHMTKTIMQQAKGSSTDGLVPKEVITDMFHKMDSASRELFPYAGAAATSIFITKLEDGSRHIRCAWVGDCRALAFSGKRSLVSRELSKDHSLERKDELKRIRQHHEKHGGAYVSKRVNRINRPVGHTALYAEEPAFGSLSITMTRSIGDEYCSKACIATPEIVDYVVGKDENARIVVASDGLWRIIDNEGAERLMKKHGDKNSAVISRVLAVEALVRTQRNLQRMSCDDITVIVIDVAEASNSMDKTLTSSTPEREPISRVPSINSSIFRAS